MNGSSFQVEQKYGREIEEEEIGPEMQTLLRTTLINLSKNQEMIPKCDYVIEILSNSI